MRTKQPTRTIWVDAICVNQNDINERNQQVTLMRDIYSSCERVIVWIRQWRRAGSIEPRLYLFTPNSMLSTFAATKIAKIESGEEVASEFLKGFLSGYFLSRGILDEPWFSRAWIVQEITICKNARVSIDKLELSWTTVESILQWMSENWAHNGAGLERLRHQRQTYMSGPRHTQDLLDIVICHRASQSTDLRDKIFAFVGIAEPSNRYGIEADYSKPVDVVFTEFTVKCIQHRNSIDVLSATTSAILKETRLPSWIFSPVYDEQYDVQWQSMLVWRGHQRQFAASKSCSCVWALSADHGTLYLEGAHFDTISEIERRFPFWRGIIYSRSMRMIPFARYLSTVGYGVDMLRCFCNWRQVLSARDGTTYTPTNEPFREVFWQVLCCGSGEGMQSDSVQKFEQFDALIRLFWKSPSWLHESSIWMYLLFLVHIPTFWLRFFTVLLHVLSRTSMAGNRRLFVTHRGALGLGPFRIAAGDEMVIFKGAKVPLIVRRLPGTDTWNLVGEAYAHGIMYGETFDEAKCSTYAIV